MIELAGIPLDVLNEEKAVLTFFEKYKSDKKALFSIYASKEDEEYERGLTENKNANRYKYLLSAIC